MAHITEFTVEGLVGRADPYSQKLDRHVNVFFGLNGSGKTSLLKILHSAMSNDAEPLRAVPFTRAEVKIYSVDYARIFTYTCEKKEEPTPKSSQEQIDLFSKGIIVQSSFLPTRPPLTWDISPAFPEKLATGWNHRYLPTSRLYLSAQRSQAFLYSTRGEQSISEEQLEESFSTLVNQLWSAYSAKVLGTVQRAQAKGLAHILELILSEEPASTDANDQLDPSTAFERVGRFLDRQGSKAILGDIQAFQRNYLAKPQLRSVVNDINAVELQIQEAMAPRDKLQSLIEEMFSGKKKVIFTDASIDIKVGGDVAIGLARLSSGEKHLLRIFVDTLLAEVSSLIIDEPEISMHVDWQKKLIAAMSQLNPSAQFILATHSPEITADLPDANIFRL